MIINSRELYDLRLFYFNLIRILIFCLLKILNIVYIKEKR